MQNFSLLFPELMAGQNKMLGQPQLPPLDASGVPIDYQLHLLGFPGKAPSAIMRRQQLMEMLQQMLAQQK